MEYKRATGANAGTVGLIRSILWLTCDPASANMCGLCSRAGLDGYLHEALQ